MSSRATTAPPVSASVPVPAAGLLLSEGADASPNGGAFEGLPHTRPRRASDFFGGIRANTFGMVLGLGGLTNAWRSAEQVWNLQPLGSLVLTQVVCWLWAACLATLAAKWLLAPRTALAETRDPYAFAFYALLPMSTLVLSLALRDQARHTSFVLFVMGLVLQVLIATLSTANLWRGERQLDALDSAILMPAVGGCFVGAAAAGGHDCPDVGVLFFGAALGSWLVTESLVLQRLALHALPPSRRATLGIHLTPSAIASVAYLSITSGTPNLFAQMLFGYGLLQALVTLRLVPWLRQQPFALGTWAYTFGLSALSLGALRFILRGQKGVIAGLGLPLFVIVNVVVLWIAARTVLETLHALARWRTVSRQP